MKSGKKLLSALTAIITVQASGIFAISAGAEDIQINGTTFPDLDFRSYIFENFDLNQDGYLSQAERSAVTSITAPRGSAQFNNVSSVKGIEYFPNLKSLTCVYSNKLVGIDLSHNPKLEYLDCSNNYKMTSLDVSMNPALKELNCSGSKLIKTLDLSRNPALEVLDCSSVLVPTLDVSKNTALKKLDCSNGILESLDLRKNTALTELCCSNLRLTSLDVSRNTALTRLDCMMNKIAYIDLSKNKKLETIYCQGNRLAYVDLSHQPKIKGYSIGGDYYPIGTGDTFNLSGIYGFDLSRASNWQGATYNAATNTLSNFTSDRVSYTYDSKGVYSFRDQPLSFDFYLSRVEPNPPVYDPSNPDPSMGGVISENTVWANGRDIKDDKKTPDIDETELYKTFSYRQTGSFSGGKWCVAVTDSGTNTVDKFLSLFDESGKLNANGKTVTGNAKKLASAKLKEGLVTVTAGKEAGSVRVWVYELKNKKIVVDESRDIAPMSKEIDVLMAPGSPVIAESGDLSDGVLVSGKKAVSKLTLMYKNGASSQESVSLGLGDKKTAFDPSSEFTYEIKQGADTAAVVLLGSGSLTVTPVKAGKADITVKSVQSGKTAKLSVTTVSAYKVTVPDGASVTYKSGKDTVTVKNGDYVPVKTVLQITASGKEIKVNGSTISKGKFTVGEEEVVISLSQLP